MTDRLAAHQFRELESTERFGERNTLMNRFQRFSSVKRAAVPVTNTELQQAVQNLLLSLRNGRSFNPVSFNEETFQKSHQHLEFIIYTFKFSCLDFCYSCFICLSQTVQAQLQLVQNAAVRLVTGTDLSLSAQLSLEFISRLF